MKRSILIALAALGGLIGAQSTRAQSGQELFQRALVMEFSNGQVRDAIQLYERIAMEFASDRSLAAQALIRLGLAHETLGSTEAQRAYQRIVSDYPDQQEQVVVARSRLAALDQPRSPADPATMLVRRVWSVPRGGSMSGNGGSSRFGVSPEGRYLSYPAIVSYPNVGRPNLAIRDLHTGESRLLTNHSRSESPGRVESPTSSPDGQEIVYQWSGDLRVVGLDGSNPRVLYRNEGIQPRPHAWSPDGKSILAFFRNRENNGNQIVLVSVADGSVRVLKTLDWRSPMGMSFSPDGRYIAYDFPPQEDSPKRDIFLLAADGSRETPLIEHPANDLFPFWAPDGKSILFSSDRTGSPGAWLIQVADGRPLGSPEFVNADLGEFPLGFTQNGSFYYGLRNRTNDVYTATLDLATGKLLSSPTKVSRPETTPDLGSNSAPDWSPDGQYLAYFSQRGQRLVDPLMIVIRSVETGEVREILPRLPYIQDYRGLSWSPHGQSLLVSGRDDKGRFGFYQIDAQTGEATPVVQRDITLAGEGSASHPRLSPDGRAIFYHRRGEKVSIVVRDLESGEERDLLRAVDPSFIRRPFVLSPDGQRLAFFMGERGTDSSALTVMPAAGGEPRELLRVQSALIPGANFYALAWTADSRELIFGRTGERRTLEVPVELWRISAEGGEPQRVGLAMKELRHLRVHPDGRRITFDASERKEEIWVMENFLPQPSGGR